MTGFSAGFVAGVAAAYGFSYVVWLWLGRRPVEQ